MTADTHQELQNNAAKSKAWQVKVDRLMQVRTKSRKERFRKQRFLAGASEF
jgi:hypothetical protein